MSEELCKHCGKSLTGLEIYERCNCTPTPKVQRTQTVLNRAAVKKYALKVATEKRPANKFSRVGESFIIGVEAELESKLRQMAPASYDGQVSVGGLKFSTKLTRSKALEKIEQLAAVIIHGKVTRHPSVGVTLKD